MEILRYSLLLAVFMLILCYLIYSFDWFPVVEKVDIVLLAATLVLFIYVQGLISVIFILLELLM